MAAQHLRAEDRAGAFMDGDVMDEPTRCAICGALDEQTQLFHDDDLGWLCVVCLQAQEEEEQCEE
jgi:hypothetical protein